MTIVCEHFRGLLSESGISKIPTVGQLFDPAFMMAVSSESSSDTPENVVIEELAPGFMLDGRLLKAAEVKVSK